MHRSKVFFKVSDIVNHPLRNYKRYPDVIVERDLTFDSRIGKFGKLDIYYTKDVPTGGRPIFVNVHGGGYVCGDKKYRSGIARHFARLGYCVININYRLAPAARYPAPTIDTIDALNFVAGLKNKQLNFNKIVISGDSAGAYYAAHTVAAIYSEELSAKLGLPKYTGVKPRALLTFCAPFNLEKCFKAKTLLSVSTDITNCVFGTKFSGNDYDFPCKDTVNVLDYVNADWCECFLSAAAHDSFCGGQIDDMVAKLKEFNIPTSTYIGSVKGDSHCSHLMPFKKGTKPNLDAVDKFLIKIRDEIRGE